MTKEMLEMQQRAEEEMMRLAMEASLTEEREKKQQIEDEEEIMKRIMEISEREEKER
jgi:hypothetical protein